MNDPNLFRPEVERVRTFFSATTSTINGKIDRLEFVNFKGKKDVELFAYYINGEIQPFAPWNLKQALQLVETGHWKMHDTAMDIPRDVPEASYGRDVW